ncbi:hypothetical protein ACFL3J_01770 [Candidatus Omnitrophota bacterium]
MVKKILIATLLLNLFFSGSAFAFQFHEYEWGTAKDEMARTVRQTGRSVEEGTDTITYNERLFKRTFLVTLFFTPKSHKLYKVEVRWMGGIRMPVAKKIAKEFDALGNIEEVDKEMKKILVDKYGKPLQSPFSHRCYWKGEDRYDLLALRYGSFREPILTYYGGDSYREYLKEKSR